MFKEEILFEIRQEARHFIDIEEENWPLYIRKTGQTPIQHDATGLAPRPRTTRVDDKTAQATKAVTQAPQGNTAEVANWSRRSNIHPRP
jgi:hypothetical protein